VEARSLSPTEAKIILSLEAEGSEVLSLENLRHRAGVAPGFARKLAHDLVRKGWLQRVRGGQYLLNPSRFGPEALPDSDPLRMGSHVVSPYYFGYATAAELWGLLPQAGRVYYLVTTAPRVSVPVRPAQYRLVRVTPARFFGVRALRRRGVSIQVSDPERTVLDCLDRPELSGGIPGAAQVLASAKPQLDWPRLSRYLRRLGNRSLALRIGYLSEIVRPDVPPSPDWIEEHRARPGEPFVPLGPIREFPRRGPRDARWHVIQNVPRRALLGEVEIR
jgi:predicted transcriptional regulator of viral defense system